MVFTDYDHFQAPTAGRIIAEMLEEIVDLGEGYCLWAGCAAGDTGRIHDIQV